jgi:hypothetical protein
MTTFFRSGCEAIAYASAVGRRAPPTADTWSDPRSAAAAVAAILDRLSTGPVDLRVRCRNGLGRCFRLHRQYDKHEHVMYIVAEETPGNAPGVRRRTEERRSALRQAAS